jgi:hypothetical protein
MRNTHHDAICCMFQCIMSFMCTRYHAAMCGMCACITGTMTPCAACIMRTKHHNYMCCMHACVPGTMTPCAACMHCVTGPTTPRAAFVPFARSRQRPATMAGQVRRAQLPQACTVLSRWTTWIFGIQQVNHFPASPRPPVWKSPLIQGMDVRAYEVTVASGDKCSGTCQPVCQLLPVR